MIPHLIGQQTVGRFAIKDFLGRGAIGDVLLAEDPREGRLVALKVVRVGKTDPEMLEAEKNGLSLQAQLAKVAPQVAAVYEEGQDADIFWVAMEYVAGSDLSETLAKGPLPEARAVGIALELVSMLEVCHEFSAEVGGRRIFGIVHGDIKPENIRLQEADRVRVLDFGIAKHLSQTRRFTVNLFGSLPYTPPERLERGVVDRHSDLWAVGVVLAAMVSGRRPFPGNTPEELEQAIRHGVPHLPLPASCSPGLAYIVDKSLAFEVSRRYPTALELKSDLLALRDGRLPAAPATLTTPESSATSASALHATRRTVPLSPLSPAEVRAAEATRRTDRAAALRPPPAIEDTRRTGDGAAVLAGPAATQADTLAAPSAAAPALAAPSAAAPAVAAPILAATAVAAATLAVTAVVAPSLAATAAAAPGATGASGAGAVDAGSAVSPAGSVSAVSTGRPNAAAGPASLAAAESRAAAPARRSRRPLRRVLALLAGVALLGIGATQVWAWNQAQQMRRDLAEVHPDLAAIAERYSHAVPWSLFSLDLFGVGDELLKSLTASAERILDSFHGDAPTTTQRGWQTAYDDLHAAAQIAPRDRKIRARMLYARAHLDRIAAISLRNQGDRKKALATSRDAVAEFQEAARADPDWPDPYLGLARIYAYDQFDLDALQKTLGQLGRRGYRLGRRETAMLADGFRMQGLEVEARAQRARGTSAEIDLLNQARDDFDQAVRYYADISGFAYSATNRVEAESHRAAVESRLSMVHRPGFWERLGRAITREIRRPGGG